ncbi:MAG: InlB B-repeat-containing protein, partial [Limisphaerales bacterium]
MSAGPTSVGAAEPEMDPGLPATLFEGDSVTVVRDIPADGLYNLFFDIKWPEQPEGRLSGQKPGLLRLEVDGATIVPWIGSPDAVPQSDGVTSHQRLHLTAGRRSLRVVADRGATNVISVGEPPSWHDFPEGYVPTFLTDPVPMLVKQVRFTPSRIWLAETYAGQGKPGSVPAWGSIDAWCDAPDGTLYVGDSSAHRLRKIAPGGEESVLAGNGQAGALDGPASEASFGHFISLALTSGNDLRVLESPVRPFDNTAREYRIREITHTGVVRTLFTGRIKTGVVWDGFWHYGDECYWLEKLFTSPTGQPFIGAWYSHWWMAGPQGHRRDQVSRVFALSAEGAFAVTTNIYTASSGAVTNTVGTEFWQGLDNLQSPFLLRRTPNGGAESIYRSADLGPVIAAHGEVVYAVKGGGIARLKESEFPCHYLSMTVSPAFYGRVDGTPGEPIPAGTVVTLNAVPTQYGFDFAHWSGDASGTNGTLELVMDRDKTLTAHFGYRVEVAAGNCTVEIEPNLAVHPYGALVRMTAIPDPGMTEVLWDDGGSGLVREFSISRPLFAAVARDIGTPTRTLHTSVLPAGAGQVIGVAPRILYEGSRIWLTAQPLPGFQFVRWSDGEASERRIVEMRGDVSLTAEFRAASTQPSLWVRFGSTPAGSIPL